MLRLFLRLIGIKDFEVCQSCETLKQQLAFERAEKKELTETLMNIIKPKAYEAPVQEIAPVTQTAGLFSRKRAALEARDREEARILAMSDNVGRPDGLKGVGKLSGPVVTVEDLEKELGIEEKREA